MPTTDEIQVRDERKPGHHWADNEVLDVFAPKIGAYGYAVYMFMGRHASNVSGRCTKSQQEIALTLAISVDSVQRAISRLIEFSLIKREQVVGKSCNYILLSVPKVGALKSTRSTNLPPKAVGAQKVDVPPTAVGVPPIAAGLPPTAVPNKEVRLNKTSSRLNLHPPTPLSEGGSENLGSGKQAKPGPENFWSSILARLKRELYDAPLSMPSDYDEMFRDTWLIETREGGVLVIGSVDPKKTAAALRKYERRLKAIGERLFNLEMKFIAEDKAA